MRVEQIGDATLYLGDCMEVLRTLPDNSVDAVVTDPPYGLSFMGKKWDYDVPATEVWAECLRVLKPGGHLLAFAGTRTQHRMAVRIEDAGFEIRDMIAWVYGSGFPKSMDVSKAIDAKILTGGSAPSNIRKRDMGDSYRPHHLAGTLGFGASRGAAGGSNDSDRGGEGVVPLATPEARQWQGWGTALKPALEPITVARKPLAGTVAECVLAHGTGALNIDGCRVGSDVTGWGGGANKVFAVSGNGTEQSQYVVDGDARPVVGRWPANLIHDGSEEVLAGFPDSEARPAKAVLAGGVSGDGGKNGAVYGQSMNYGARTGYADTERSAARFFYCAKASKRDRDEGNIHPTVKPTDLMRYLCRLVTQPGGVVLDPFMGSGSTGKAAALEGFQFIGIEREAEYLEIACKRIEQAAAQNSLLPPEPRKPEQESLL